MARVPWPSCTDDHDKIVNEVWIIGTKLRASFDQALFMKQEGLGPAPQGCKLGRASSGMAPTDTGWRVGALPRQSVL